MRTDIRVIPVIPVTRSSGHPIIPVISIISVLPVIRSFRSFQQFQPTSHSGHPAIPVILVISVVSDIPVTPVIPVISSNSSHSRYNHLRHVDERTCKGVGSFPLVHVNILAKNKLVYRRPIERTLHIAVDFYIALHKGLYVWELGEQDIVNSFRPAREGEGFDFLACERSRLVRLEIIFKHDNNQF
jgi:hypothetical protein